MSGALLRKFGQTASQALGPELMTNGDCSSATGWNEVSPSVVVAAGVLTGSGSFTASNAGTESGIEEGTTYRCSYEIKTLPTPGIGVTQRIGLSEGIARTAVGVYTEDLLASDIENEGSWRFAAGSAAAGTFDNFSCREVL
jgi:hypothetical protein